MFKPLQFPRTITALLLAGLVLASAQAVKAGDYYWEKKKHITFSAPQTRHYADPEQSRASEAPKGSLKHEEQLVENKAFSYLEAAYMERNQLKFEKLKALFQKSFPRSRYNPQLEELQNKFYYQETLTMEQLGNAVVDVPFPKAKSIKELQSYFAELKKRGMKAVQLEVVQLGGHKSYQFGKSIRMEGYYFPSRRGIMVENLLEPVLAAAHEEGLQVYASLSLRNHPELSRQRLYMLDEYWNFLAQKTELTNKLDLFNPAGKSYLYSVVDDLLRQKIDGIIIKDDFTYGQHEGFSEEARKNFALDTGLDLNLKKIFKRRLGADQDYGLLTSKEYWDFAQWRTEELKQSLWEFVAHLREKSPKLQIGLEVAPSMLLEPKKSIDKYATSLHYLRDLDVNFFILQWKKEGQLKLASPKSYSQAAEQLRKAVAYSPILLKTPLIPETMNLILLNRRIKGQTELTIDLKNMDWAIGPVDHRRGLDFIQFVPAPEGEAEEMETEEDQNSFKRLPADAPAQDTAAAVSSKATASDSTQTSATSPPKQ